MPRRPQATPTEEELRILKVIWECGPSTVREVNEVLAIERPTGYTTTLKLMQIMLEKGLLQRDESSRSHVYSSVPSQISTQKRMVKDLVDRLFDGSAIRLVAQLMSTKQLSADELGEVRKLIEAGEDKNK